jgi:hypothetical protein
MCSLSGRGSALHAVDGRIAAGDPARQLQALSTLDFCRRLANQSAEKILKEHGFMHDAAAEDEGKQALLRHKYLEFSRLTLTDNDPNEHGHYHQAQEMVGAWSMGTLGELLTHPEGFRLAHEGKGKKSPEARTSAAFFRLFDSVWRLGLVLGTRENAPHPSAPNARTIITVGNIAPRAPGGAAEVWDLTPGVVETMRRSLARVDELCGHEAVKTVYKFYTYHANANMNKGNNVASALQIAMGIMTEEQILLTHRLRAEEKMGTWGPAKVITPDKTSSGGSKGAERSSRLCDNFQKGNCHRGYDCLYKHACRECGKRGHGESTCYSLENKAREGRRRSRSRSPLPRRYEGRRDSDRADEGGKRHEHRRGTNGTGGRGDRRDGR